MYIRMEVFHMIEIYWSDLTKEKQQEILDVLGENGNYDVFPSASIPDPEMDNGIKQEMQWKEGTPMGGKIKSKTCPDNPNISLCGELFYGLEKYLAGNPGTYKYWEKVAENLERKLQ